MQIFPIKVGVPGEPGVHISAEKIEKIAEQVCNNCIIKCCCSKRCSSFFDSYLDEIIKLERRNK
jgi:hypothetical protein